MVWSLFRAMETALVDGDEERITRLFEASLSFTVRMRLNPTYEQQILDKLSFIEAIRITSVAAGADSFFDFVTFVGQLPAVTDDITGPKLMELCKTLGITFEGKTIVKNLAYAILAVLPYTRSAAACSAVKFVEGLARTLFSEPTKLMRACQVLKKHVQLHELNDAFEYWMWFVAVDILCGEMKIEEANTSFLVGEKKYYGPHAYYYAKTLFR